jgi:hypothetical protein
MAQLRVEVVIDVDDSATDGGHSRHLLETKCVRR